MFADLNRRAALLAPLSVAVALQGADAMAQSGAPSTPYEPRPLPLTASAIPGLSERLLTSHWQNNYTGAVRRLNAIDAALAALDMSTAPGFQLNGLKREELIALNSMVLHEVYFAGLGGEARTPNMRLGSRIERDFGSFERWRTEFAAMGKALGGGSGWVLLTWSPRAQRLINTWAADHTMTAAGADILLALDMYEHAYAIDYGAAAGPYVDAFMSALRWDTADRAFAALSLDRR